MATRCPPYPRCCSRPHVFCYGYVRWLALLCYLCVRACVRACVCVRVRACACVCASSPNRYHYCEDPKHSRAGGPHKEIGTGEKVWPARGVTSDEAPSPGGRRRSLVQLMRSMTAVAADERKVRAYSRCDAMRCGGGGTVQYRIRPGAVPTLNDQLVPSFASRARARRNRRSTRRRPDRVFEKTW